MGRTSTARERLLAAACDLMRTRGYGAAGVAEICVRADVRKGSFYHFFPSKQALTLAAIDAHWGDQRADWEEALRSTAPALDRLRRLVDDTIAAQRRTQETDGAVSGCVLANLSLELSIQDDTVQNRLREIFEEQVALIETVLREAVAEGSIPAASATGSAARSVVAQMEGLILFAKLGNDPDVLGGLWPQTLLLLRADEKAVT